MRAQQGKADEALADVDELMGAEDFKTGQSNCLETFSRLSMLSSGLQLAADDKVAVFIARASLLNLARRIKDANKTLSEAKMLFAGTPQEVQILVASSHLAVERGDYDSAIRVLDKINEDSSTYNKAQLIKAEILLTNNRDKEGFTKCYERLVERDKSSAAFSMLGEAYLRILNPEAAVEAFEQVNQKHLTIHIFFTYSHILSKAYALDPTNAQLRERIGKSLVATHEYHRAVDFYESALREVSKSGVVKGGKSSEAFALGHDLAKLYLKLGRAESASRVLNITLYETHRDIYEMRNDIKTYRLLVEVQRLNAPNEMLETLRKAKELQKNVINEVRLSLNSAAATSSEIMDKERQLLSDLCIDFGKRLEAENDLKGAEAQFNEALTYSAQNVAAIIALARLYKSKKNIDGCIAQCRKIILFDSSHEEACILMSETLVQERDGEEEDEEAAKPLKDLLAGHPNNYHALSSLLSLLRKTGQLDLGKQYIADAEKNRRAGSHPGLRYCRGLFARFTNEIGRAIHEFNFARKDTVWGEKALINMIELYLNPDQEGIWEEREESKNDEATMGHIRIAGELLKELKPLSTDDTKYATLVNYCGYAHKERV